LVKHSAGIALLSIGVAFGAVGSVKGVTTAAVQAEAQQKSWGIIEQNCVGCHNSKVKAGGRAFDVMSPDNIAHDAETWEAAIRKLRGGLMPPAGAKRPDKQAVTDLISFLESKIDAAAVKTDPGRVPLHRLNRREYANAIRDLLALNIDGEALLPTDNVKGNFDNDAAALQVSPSFVDQYIYAARAVALEAVGNLEAPPVTTTYGDVANMVISLPPSSNPGEGRQQHHLDGMPLGTRGGMMVEHNFPADGEYELTIGDMALAREVPRMEFENTVIALMDGKEFYRTNIGGEADHKAIDQLLDPAVEKINGRLRKIKFKATAGQHKIAVTFVHRSFAESDERIRTTALEGGQERIQAVHALEIRGPMTVSGLGESPSRKSIFICKPAKASDETACARRILTNLAQRAFRRPVNDADLAGLMKFYQDGRAKEDFEHGVRDALSAVLASPHFLYRAEAAVDAGGMRTLNDLELASRLSFFLWSSLPDKELLDLAIASRLSDPAVLPKQVKRMLADPRAKTLVNDFAFQWLHVSKLDELTPDRGQFPQASGILDQRSLMKEELRLYIDSVLRSDSSVLDLMTANYTFLNERLAMHYGIETVKGDKFRKVILDDPRRYGLLGKGAILSMTAYPNRTSPVLRGAWILDHLLGTPPPAPPPNVPTLQENRPGQTAKTMRERLEQHRANSTCFACHGVMDPLGFALENFNAVGQFRSIDPDTKGPVNTAGTLPDGTVIGGPEDLRKALVAQPDRFIQTFSENLFTYALGRSTDYRDMPTVRGIVRRAATDNYRFESIVLGIVSSDAFRKREALDTVAQASIK